MDKRKLEKLLDRARKESPNKEEVCILSIGINDIIAGYRLEMEALLAPRKERSGRGISIPMKCRREYYNTLEAALARMKAIKEEYKDADRKTVLLNGSFLELECEGWPE